jgi:1-deoxy-D-xylulose-5-phosphate synthase
MGMVPDIRIAAPRDEPTLRTELREAIEYSAGPTVIRYPKTPLGDDIPTIRTVGGVDVVAEPDPDTKVDVLVVAVGATATSVLEAAGAIRSAGFTVRVVDPRWVTPVDPGLFELARLADLVVTVEDGVVDGGVGSRLSQSLRDAGIDVPTREIGIPARFLAQGKVKDVQASVGLTVLDIGRRIVEWSARIHGAVEHDEGNHGDGRDDLDRTRLAGPDESRQRGD